MRMNDLPQGEKYIRSRRFHKRWHKVLMVLGSAVVFCTTYALILPAITMERGCQIPEHTHTDACYTQVSSVRKMVPVCTPETLEIHQHTAACYDADGEVNCGYADFVVHTHDDACYDENGKLWCPLPEIRTHTHTEACYAQAGGELQCPLSESEAVEAHQHTDDCYAEERSELACGRVEVILHRHAAACRDETGSLICGKMQVLQHQHSDACFEAVEVPVDADVLTCTIPEEGGHQHTARCYGVWELTCGREEHTHTGACKTAGLTEEEQAQVNEVIARIDTLPTREEITEIQNSFEATGDEDGCNMYLAELTVKAKAAYEAYRVTGWTTEETSAAKFVTPDSGKFAIKGLDSDTYFLKETTAPAGCNALKDPVKVVIDENGSVTYGEDSTPARPAVKVLNQSGTELPSTGGMGTAIFYAIGSLLVIAAGVLLVTKKRMGNKA